jgi:leucyl aminopeptidase
MFPYQLKKYQDFTHADVLITLFFEDEKKINPSLSFLSKEYQNLIEQYFITKDWKLKKDAHISFQIIHEKKVMTITIIGTGKKKEWDIKSQYSFGAIALHSLKAYRENHKKFTCAFAGFKEKNLTSILEGMYMADYTFTYRTKEEKYPIRMCTFLIPKEDSKIVRYLENEKNIATGLYTARDLVNAPPNIINPQAFEEEAQKIQKKSEYITLEVLQTKELQKQGLNLLYNVGKGSECPPRMLIIKYHKGPKKQKILGFVGKGITFDTGGYNIKPTGHMEEMKGDMGGAASVLGCFHTLALQEPEISIIGIIPLAENRISHNSYLPSDIIKGYNGKTVEIGNTDAEGRLILADGISYLEKNYKPESIITIATLTGACLMALGMNRAGLFTHSTKLFNHITEAAKISHEPVWRLPLGDEYTECMKSDIADLSNAGKKSCYGGASTAASFLQEFVDKTPYAHIDIAGPAMSSSPSALSPTFGSGFGVKLLWHTLNQK